MALSDVATATPAGFSTSARIALAFGTAPSANDLIIVFAVTDTGHTVGGIFSASSGGTNLGFTSEDNQTGGAAGSSYLSKIATGTEPATMYLDFSGATEAGRAWGWIVRGADTTTPIISKVYGLAADSDGLGGTDFLEPPSNVTPSSADDWVVGFFGRDETSSPTAQERDGHAIQANLIQAGNAVLYVTRKQSGTAQTPKIDTTSTGEFACFGFAIKAGAASGQTVAAGQTTETDAAQVAARRKTRATGQPTEAATAQAVGRAKVKALGRAAETGTAQGLAVNPLRRLVGRATETATAQSVAANPRRRLLGAAIETDAVTALGAHKRAALGRASEVDEAQVITPTQTGGDQTIAVGQAAELDVALAVTARKTLAVGQPTDTAAAQALAARKTLAVGRATGSETAQSITPPGTTVVPVGQATETAAAQPIAVDPQRRLLRQTTGGDTAGALGVAKARLVGQATTAGAAGAVSARRTLAVGQVTETNAAQGVRLFGVQFVAVGQATTIDAALALRAWFFTYGGDDDATFAYGGDDDPAMTYGGDADPTFTYGG